MHKFTGYLFIVYYFLLLYGCATKNDSNILKLSDEYYIDSVIKNNNFQELKVFLTENKIKLGLLTVISNLPNGNLNAIVIDGQIVSWAARPSSDWILRNQTNFSSLVLSEFFDEKLGVYTLSYCGDYTHSHIAENGAMGSVEYTYILSKMTANERQSTAKSKMRASCEMDDALGEVIYKKKLVLSAKPENTKISIALKDNTHPIERKDNVSIIIRSILDEAMTSLYTDKNLLLALKKDYQITGGRILPPQTIIAKPVIIDNKSKELIEKQSPSIDLDVYKSQCKDLGFKVGTPGFGNCVLELNDAK